MMPIAHIGITAGEFWLTRQKVDYRLAALDAPLPDLIDNAFNPLLFPGEMAGWLVCHTLVFNAVLALIGFRFRWVLIIGLAPMSHFLLDRVWRSLASFWWPFQGWSFPQAEGVGIACSERSSFTQPFASSQGWFPAILSTLYLPV